MTNIKIYKQFYFPAILQMPSNLGPKAKIKRLKNAQRSARRTFRDFSASLQTPAV